MLAASVFVASFIIRERMSDEGFEIMYDDPADPTVRTLELDA
jgi:hypothetical protein